MGQQPEYWHVTHIQDWILRPNWNFDGIYDRHDWCDDAHDVHDVAAGCGVACGADCGGADDADDGDDDAPTNRYHDRLV